MAKKTIKELTEELEALKKENQELKDSISITKIETTMGCPVEEAIAAVERLKKENEDLKYKNTHMERKIDTLRSIIRNTRDDNDELKEAIEKKDKEHDILERKCGTLRELLSSLCVAAVDADDVRKAIDEEDWCIVRQAIQNFQNCWYNKADHVKEVEEKLAKKEKDYEALKDLCRRISDENKEAQETVNKQRDMLTYWNNFAIKYLGFSRGAIGHIEQGYYVEAKAALALCDAQSKKELIDKNAKLKEENKWLVDEISELRKEKNELEIKFKHCDDKLTRLRNFMLDNLNYTGSIVQKIELGRYAEALREIEANYKIKLNKIYGAGGDCDSDYPKLQWEHAGKPLLHWDTDTNTYTLNLNGTHVNVANDGSIMLPGCKISFNAKAGCYTFDIGGQHITATTHGNVYIDKE